MFAVIVVFLERIDLTERCARSIMENTREPFELILVDNASSSRIAEKFKKKVSALPDVRVVTSGTNLGGPGGKNFGFKHVSDQADHVAIFDNDCIIMKDWDRHALDAIEEHNLDAIQPMVLKKNGDLEWGCLRYEIIGDEIHFNHHYNNDNSRLSQTEPEWVNAITGLMIMRKEAYASVGGHDDQCRGMGDWEMGFRMDKAGKKIMYVPRCKVIHDHQSGVIRRKEDRKYENTRKDRKRILQTEQYLYEKHGLHFLPKQQREFMQFIIDNNLDEYTFINRLKIRYHRKRLQRGR
jgi:GT2 family glycosyltransferase